jgi:hypothetical protein
MQIPYAIRFDLGQGGSCGDVSDLGVHVVQHLRNATTSTSERTMFRYISRLPVSEKCSEIKIWVYMRSYVYSLLL